MKRIFFLLIFMCIYIGVNGQVTYLDSSLNATGILALNHAGGVDVPAVSLTRPNGKSLMIGYSYFDTRVPSSTLTTATVVQFDLNGEPDATFGQNGIVVLDQLKNDASAADAVLQPDGKLLITGKYLNSTAGPHHFVVRLNEDGSLDGSFGVDGVAGHPDGGLVAWGSSVAVQMDGKIVMGGTRFIYDGPLSSGLYELTLIRFLPNGLVDSSFGENGVVLTSFSTKSDALAIAFDTENSIYVGGLINFDHSLITRFLPNGTLDLNFGTDGIVLLPKDGGVSDILIQTNGQIIVGGARTRSNWRGFIYRLHTNGSLDPDFDNTGIEGDVYLSGIANGSDGKIWVGTVGYSGLRIFRYLPNGNLDPGFDQTLTLYSGLNFRSGLSLQSDGKLMVGGRLLNNFGFQDFCLLRLNETIEIDSQYGMNGLAVQNFGTSKSGANSVIVDDQNRILVGGEATYIDKTTIVNLPTVHSIGFVSRLQQNGNLDTTFSAKGIATMRLGSELMNLIAKQTDGKIISAGSSYDANSGPGFGVTRLLPDGTEDTTFGPSGSGYSGYYLDWSFYEAYASNVAICPDKKIVIIGKVVGGPNQSKIALIRFDSSGLPDPSFGLEGLVLSDAITGSNLQVNAGLVLPDGKILVLGTYSSPVPNIFLVRFQLDGILDNSFGTGGVVLKPFSGLNYLPTAIARQSDGKILLCGSQSGANLLIGRLNPDGAKDLSFSSDGLVIINTGITEAINAIVQQADGKVVVAGWSSSSSEATQRDPLVARLLANGTLDSSFAETGYLVTPLSGSNLLKALAIQSDGSYITAGYSNNDYLLIRYLSKLNVGLLAEPAFASELLVYPNPVRGQVAFAYTLSTQSNVSVELFDMQGKRCQRFLLNENRPQGGQTEYLNFAKNLTPGVYTLRIQAGKGSRSVQVLIVE